MTQTQYRLNKRFGQVKQSVYGFLLHLYEICSTYVVQAKSLSKHAVGTRTRPSQKYQHCITLPACNDRTDSFYSEVNSFKPRIKKRSLAESTIGTGRETYHTKSILTHREKVSNVSIQQLSHATNLLKESTRTYLKHNVPLIHIDKTK